MAFFLNFLSINTEMVVSSVQHRISTLSESRILKCHSVPYAPGIQPMPSTEGVHQTWQGLHKLSSCWQPLCSAHSLRQGTSKKLKIIFVLMHFGLIVTCWIMLRLLKKKVTAKFSKHFHRPVADSKGNTCDRYRPGFRSMGAGSSYIPTACKGCSA